jgi:hypothetical protein
VVRLEPATEIGPRPGATAVGDRVGAAQDRGGEVRLFRRIEPPPWASLRPVFVLGAADGQDEIMDFRSSNGDKVQLTPRRFTWSDLDVISRPNR